MAPKSLKNTSKKSRKESSSSKDSIIMIYKRKIKEKMDTINTITLIPIGGDAYVLSPTWKTLKGANTFPFITSEEHLLFKKDLDLNFQLKKNQLITTWPIISKEYIQWLDYVHAKKGKTWK